jgi:phosphoserine phosphatase
MKSLCNRLMGIVLICVVSASAYAGTLDPLPSWNNTEAKSAILCFLSDAVDECSPTYVFPEERIAVFDQDGTLWVEQPIYTQLAFVIERFKKLAPEHPEWKVDALLKTLDAGVDGLKGLTSEDIGTLIGYAQSGVTVGEYKQLVREWLRRSIHPRFQVPYTQLVYQPMLEVMNLFRDCGFKTYIVSGGGQEFIRVYAEEVYGVPPEQVIGTVQDVNYEYRDGKPVLVKIPKMLFIDDKEQKPESINMFIGRRPCAAFGNSDGDRQMLEWTQAGNGPKLMMLVYHDDPRREYRYGAESKIGTFSDALMSEAKRNRWSVISMKNDWRVIFPCCR